jgi:threonine dehydrogenase-like Zn-dependent dehydrogenase
MKRLKLAKELGADGVIDVEEVDDVVQAVGELFGTEGADLVVECSGAAAAAKTLVDLASRGARFVKWDSMESLLLFLKT